MAEPHPSSTENIRDNPLSYDHLLFDMYMITLTSVLSELEIKTAFDDYELSAAALRMKMAGNARQVFESAASEFRAYQETLAYVSAGAANPDQISHGSRAELRSILHGLSVWMAAVGVLFLASGLASFAVWPWTEPLIWAGLATLFDSAVTWILSKDLFTDALRGAVRTMDDPALTVAGTADGSS